MTKTYTTSKTWELPVRSKFIGGTMTEGIDYNDITQLSDEYLQERIKINKQGAEHYGEVVKNLLAGVAEDQAELDRRALEAWWAAHPEQTRVNVGDKLLVTPEYNDWYSKPHGWSSGFDIGAVLNVTSVYVEDNILHVRSDEELTMGVDDPIIIQNMRAAYLAQQESAR